MRRGLLTNWRVPDEFPADRAGRAEYEGRVRRWQRALYLPMILLILMCAGAGWVAGPRIARFVVWHQIDQAARQAPRPPLPTP